MKKANCFNKGLTELVFILDRSGSMAGLESDTIGGFNSMLAKQRGVDGEAFVTTVLFSTDYELLHDRIDIRAVSPIAPQDYEVGGGTALLDAIGKTIGKIDRAQRSTAGAYRAENIMFVIITDGEENSSREYSSQAIKGLIEKKRREGWEFLFLGANIDAVETAAHFGIAPDRAQSYHSDSRGTSLNYEVVGEAVKMFRQTSAVPEKWSEEIAQDFNRRG